MKDSGVLYTVIFSIFVALLVVFICGFMIKALIDGAPVYTYIIGLGTFMYIFYRLFVFFARSGFLYINSSKALSENINLAKECCEELNQIERPKLIVDLKQKMIKCTLLWIGSFFLLFGVAFFLNGAAFFEMLFLVSLGICLWLLFYTIVVIFSYIENLKRSITGHELAITENSFFYKRPLPNIPLDASFSEHIEEVSKMSKKQIKARNSYENANFDNKTCSPCDLKVTVLDDIELDITFNEKIHVQMLEALKSFNGRHVLVLFKGIFVNYSSYKTEKDYSVIRLTNDKRLVSKDYFGKRLQTSQSKFDEHFFVYSDNDSMAMKLFSSDLVESLLEANDFYKLKYEVLIQNHDIYIRIFENRLFKVHVIGKVLRAKDVARDITTIQYAKLLAEILRNATLGDS